MNSGRVLLVLVLFWGLVSCAGETGGRVGSKAASAEDSQALRPEPRPLPRPDGTTVSGGANDWGLHTHRNVMLSSQNLVLSLPQGDVWKSAPRRGTWSGLLHEATHSEIWVRHVAARRTVTLEECERQARLSWPLIRDVEESAAERFLRAPQGYGGRLLVILLPDGGGRVEAFSVGVSRCLSVVFTTGGRPGFPERLRVGVNEIIETMRVPDVGERSGIRPVTRY